MAVEQLCFFKFPRPLLERFGTEFFKSVPPSPGVYIFSGERDRVLYVGQSKNLRLRLSYYKNAQPEREPRRIIRLVHQTRRIVFEPCLSATSARLRELALIGQHRPRFNVANAASPAFTFFALGTNAEGFSMRISMNQGRRDGEKMIGAFRNRGLCTRAFCSIARMLVARQSSIRSAYDFPAWLHPRARHWTGLDPGFREMTEALVSGEDTSLLEKSAELAETASDPFLRQIFEADFLVLSEFFELAQEMRKAREFHETAVLSQEALQVTSHCMKERIEELS